jgi:hypothetical protein
VNEAHTYDLLHDLVPALCQRDPKVLRLYADAIETMNSTAAFPLHKAILYEAARLARQAKRLPVTPGEFRKLVEKHMGRQVDPGQFHNRCADLGYTFRKDPKHGGRPKRKR